MRRTEQQLSRELVLDVQRRLPAGQRLIQEAFTSDHRRPVMVKVAELAPDTFYVFDEITAHAFADAALDLATQHGGRLTLNYPFFGEFQAQKHRLQHVAQKLEAIRVLSLGHRPAAGDLPSRVEFESIAGTLLTRFRLAINQGPQSFAFVARDSTGRGSSGTSTGFFTFDADIVDSLASDIDSIVNGRGGHMGTFNRLQLLHQTTQRVARELDSYSRRLELAIRRAQRRPDLLTPLRFERIVRQAIVKMEQLQDIPRCALRTIGKSPRR